MSYASAECMAEFRPELERQVRQLISATLGAVRAAKLGDLPQVAGPNGSLATTRRPFPEGQTFGGASSQPLPAARTKGRRLQRLKTLRRAVEWQIQLETGEIGSRAQIARREGLSRAAVTLAMRSLDNLTAGEHRLSDDAEPSRGRDGTGQHSSHRVEAYRDLRRAVLRRFENEYVSKLLHAAGNNISLAAKLAGIDRKHFWRLMKRSGVR